MNNEGYIFAIRIQNMQELCETVCPSVKAQFFEQMKLTSKHG